MKFLGPSMQDMGGGSSSGINLIDFSSLTDTTIPSGSSYTYYRPDCYVRHTINKLVYGGSTTCYFRLNNKIFYEKNLTKNDIILIPIGIRGGGAFGNYVGVYDYSIYKTDLSNSYIAISYDFYNCSSKNYFNGDVSFYFKIFIIDRG